VRASLLLPVVFFSVAFLRAAEPAPAPPRNISYNTVAAGPRSPEEERLSFTLPPGFEI